MAILQCGAGPEETWRQRPKTKIVCTLGRASRSAEMCARLLRAGMCVARFDFSHGSHDYHQETLDNLRQAMDLTGILCAVMLDTKQHGIPAFGDWETTGNTPYAQKFEDVRRNKKTGVSSSPNDPRRNHEPPRKSPLHPSTYTPEAFDRKPKY